MAEDWAKRIVIRQFNILHFNDHLFSLQRELLSKIHEKNTINMLPNNYLRILEIIKANNHLIIFPEEYEYINKNFR